MCEMNRVFGIPPIGKLPLKLTPDCRKALHLKTVFPSNAITVRTYQNRRLVLRSDKNRRRVRARSLTWWAHLYSTWIGCSRVSQRPMRLIRATNKKGRFYLDANLQRSLLWSLNLNDASMNWYKQITQYVFICPAPRMKSNSSVTLAYS